MNMDGFRTFCFSLALALAVVPALSAPATAAEPYHERGMPELSPEKLELARKLYEDFHKDTLAARQELYLKRRELDAQMYSAQPDESKIQSLAKEIADLRARLHSARVALKSALLKEGLAFGHRGRGRGMGRGHGGCGGYGDGNNCGDGCGRGDHGPGMGRGHGPGWRGGGFE
jgi:Spy/CpxP family protein refolding chaperone